MQDYRGVMGRAVEFVPDGELQTTLMAFTAVARASVVADCAGRQVFVPGEMERLMRERLALCCDAYAEMRDPGGLGWVHRKAVDHLPIFLRCAIDGADWRDHVPDPDSDVWCRTTLERFDDIVLGRS